MKQPRITRRQFISIVAATGTALAVGLPALDKLKFVSKSRILMGTRVNLTLLSRDQENAETAAEACLTEMAGLESILSRHQPASQLSILNYTGSLDHPHPALKEMLTRSRELSDLTRGAFDITVKPLLDLYQEAAGSLAPDQIQQALELVNYQNLILEDTRAYFASPGMSITLDGIAKGYIVDAGVKLLQLAGYINVLVEAGGDLTASGGKGRNTPWRIGLQDPRGAMGEILTRVELRDRSLATSGDYLQKYTTDLTSHHILDPRTGFSPPDFSSVSVSASSAALADGLATAIMVLGEDGLGLIESVADCEAYTVSKSGLVRKTAGFLEI